MIAEAVRFLRDRLNSELPRATTGGAVEDLFVYVGTGNDDALTFKGDAVSMLLIRIEEETTHRQPDRYQQVAAGGLRQRVEPEIRMNLYILLVARFPGDYSLALQHLSRVVAYFQNHRVLNHETSPDFDERIPKLVVELVTPSFSEQNEIWGALRAAYQPSALYKVRMVVFQDANGRPLTPTQEVVQHVLQVPSQ